jgi:beta-RFAP synthase
MIRVTTASRLHFGLLNLTPGGSSTETGLSRRFGGVGLMVEKPGLRLTATEAEDWSADGPLAERALAFARRFVQSLPADFPARPHHLVVEQAPPEHVGLGTGTQLGLATARALAAAYRLGLDVPELARRVGRGLRSGLGAHGFEHGGFLVDAGKRDADTLAPLVVRVPFPEAWRVVVAVPPGQRGTYGDAEIEAFARLAELRQDHRATDELCRLVLLGMLPALIEADVEAFGEALHEFNARVGEAFAAVQGGTYAGTRVAEWVAFARRQGLRGAGQSSWGPAVFAVADEEERARDVAARMRTHFGLGATEVFVTQAANRGASAELTGFAFA